MDNIQSEIRALAHRHLDSADGNPATLLRRLDRKLQRQETQIEQAKKKEALLDSVGEIIRQGAAARDGEAVNSMLDQVK